MKILIVNSAEPNRSEFSDSIKEILSNQLVESEVVEYRDCLTVQLDDFNGVIISGSPQGDDIVEHHQPFFQWVKAYQRPVLGICAGHHVIGVMYGAKYLRSEEPESEDVLVEVLRADKLFENMPVEFDVRQMHNDSITLPSRFLHLAKSKTCFNQAMRHAEKPLYTLQFHPEFINHKILLNFVALCQS